MGSGMRALKIITIVMGVLIVLGTAVVLVTIVRRTTAGTTERSFAAELDEPAGTSIVGIASVRDRLAVQLHGGGVDRLVLIDPLSGMVVGRIALAR
jgi:hypothetical protein